ncbi:hypothetical protein HYY70_03830 [Candidatus Woesearchaeota archaeon]|nr:hypothetical protein [Candidatus Woesearchaeota archaeon]
MKSLIGGLRGLVSGESLSTYERFNRLGIGEYQGEREKTKQFLGLSGDRISALEQIAERGDLIAVIDGWGGFISLVTDGINKKHYREGMFFKRKLYDKALTVIGETAIGDDGVEIVQVRFNTPEWFYWARLDEKSKYPYKFPEDIQEGSEVWFRGQDIPAEAFTTVPRIVPRMATMGWYLSNGDVKDGLIHRLTSPVVIDRIRSAIQNVRDSPTFYYPYF